MRDVEFGTGFALAGVVIDGGEPLAGASVSAAGMAGASGHGRTDAAGRFRIEGLPAGSYQILVGAGMGILHSQALELVGDRQLVIEIATGSISGVVVDAAAGEPLAGARAGRRVRRRPGSRCPRAREGRSVRGPSSRA